MNKAIRRKHQTTLDEQEKLATEFIQEGEDKEEAETRNCLFIFNLRDDGIWLRVGDIVSVEGLVYHLLFIE